MLFTQTLCALFWAGGAEEAGGAKAIASRVPAEGKTNLPTIHAALLTHLRTHKWTHTFCLHVQKRALLIEGGEELANTLKPPAFMVEQMQSKSKKLTAPPKVTLD